MHFIKTTLIGGMVVVLPLLLLWLGIAEVFGPAGADDGLELLTNTVHHQAIKAVAPGLAIRSESRSSGGRPGSGRCSWV